MEAAAERHPAGRNGRTPKRTETQTLHSNTAVVCHQKSRESKVKSGRSESQTTPFSGFREGLALVPDLAEQTVPPFAVIGGFDPPGRTAIDYAQDSPPLITLRQDHFDRVGGGAKD